MSFSVPSTAGTDDEAANEVLGQLDRRLSTLELCPDDVVRTRIRAASPAARAAASVARAQVLVRERRAASSSYVVHRSGDAPRVVLDVVALVPGGEGRTMKRLHEHDPPRTPIRFLTVGSLTVLSGTTSTESTLEAQLRAIVAAIERMLEEAGGGPASVVDLRCFLRRDERPATLLASLPPWMASLRCGVRVEQVDGFSAVEKRAEIEVTAVVPRDRRDRPGAGFPPESPTDKMVSPNVVEVAHRGRHGTSGRGGPA